MREPIPDAATAAVLLQQGLAFLQAGDTAQAGAALCQARQHPDTRLAAHNLIEGHGLPGGFRPMFGLQCEIAPADDIFHFFAGHPTSINPLRGSTNRPTRSSFCTTVACAGPPVR